MKMIFNILRSSILALLAIAFCSEFAHASWNDSIPADNEYVYKVPADIRQNLVALETGTDPALCLTNAKICSGTQIPNANLAAITTASMVSGAALYSLSSTPSGAGALPVANGGTGQTTRQAALNALAAVSLSGTSGEDLVSNGTNVVLGYPAGLSLTSQTAGDFAYYTGSAWVRLGSSVGVLQAASTGATPAYGTVNLASTSYVAGVLGVANGGTGSSSGVVHGMQTFTSSGTFTAQSTGVVWVTECGGGGGGAGGNGSGAGGGSGNGGAGGNSGTLISMQPFFVTSGNGYTVTIGNAGTNGSGGTGNSIAATAGGNGGTTSFSTLTASGGTGGAITNSGYGGTGAGGNGGSPNGANGTAGGTNPGGYGGSGGYQINYGTVGTGGTGGSGSGVNGGNGIIGTVYCTGGAGGGGGGNNGSTTSGGNGTAGLQGLVVVTY